MALILAVLIVGMVAAFILSFAMGANDVANSFGTSVGSKVLTLKQAVIVAAIFETLGSVLVGYQVTDTVRKGIVDISIYERSGRADQLAFGALATLISSCLWLFIATFKKLPVSASHAIVGATLGFTLVLSGSAGVHWSVLGFIVASWFVSPVLSGAVSAALYYFVYRCILKRRDPIVSGMKVLPLIYAVTVFINVLAILWKGPQMLHLHNVPNWMAILLAAVVAVTVAVFAKLCLVKPERRYKRQGSLRRLPPGSSRGTSPIDQRVDAEREAEVVRYNADTKNVLATIANGHPPPSYGKGQHSVEVLSIPSVVVTTASGQNINHDEHIDVERKQETAEIKTDKIVQQEDEGIAKSDNNVSVASSSETSTGDSSNTTSNTSNELSAKPLDEQPKSTSTDEVDHDIECNSLHKRTSLTSNSLLPTSNDGKSPPSPTVTFSPTASPSPPPISRSQSTTTRTGDEMPETKILFSYVQIMTACCASFAHGGNDVSNSIGPLVTLWLIYQTGSVSSNLPVPLWVLAFGGVGISLGLLILGRRVIETIGEDLTHSMTPASGFCIELGTVMTVLFASKLGVPVSTTHCIVGSVIAVGYLRSREEVDLRLFRSIAMSWIVTLPATVAFSAAIMFGFQLVLPNVFM